MASYTVNGVRFDSIVDARAFAVKITWLKGHDVKIPVYNGKKIEGYVYSHFGNRYYWTKNRGIYDISMDGTLIRGPVSHKPSPGELRPYTYRRY